MIDSNAQEIERFVVAVESIPPSLAQVTKIISHGYLLTPNAKSQGPTRPSQNPDLTILAIMHGNEIVGTRILTELVRIIALAQFELKISVSLVLCNVEAAVENRRFLDQDLNRCFGQSANLQATREQRRARELEPILSKSKFMLDLHQTIEPSETPFFIFPYNKSSYEFAGSICPDIPVVTHWNDVFSTEGRCSDEYVQSVGGVGITVELGQNGIHPYRVAAGLHYALAAIGFVTQKIYGHEISIVKRRGKLFTWGQVVPFFEKSSTHEPALNEGWYNFKQVTKGEIIGKRNGDNILSSGTGPILFPRYPRGFEPGTKPTELCRILKEIKECDLPADG